MEQGHSAAGKSRIGRERQVVIIMTDMVHYSSITAEMTPTEICAFLSNYHSNIHSILEDEAFQPMEIEPIAGDGGIITFDKRPGETPSGICTRALLVAMRLTCAISESRLVSTRMGLMLGYIVESKIGEKTVKNGSCLAVASRLEELSGYFNTCFLMDREIARYQQGFDDYVVNVAKVSLACVPHPLNLFTVYVPGSSCVPENVDKEKLKEMIRHKNQAMELFSGNMLKNIVPDFPQVYKELLESQAMFQKLTGTVDHATGRIFEYIREIPQPGISFRNHGMEMLEKNRSFFGKRLLHLSKELLRAMNPDVFEVLVENTEWEQYFKLEWFHEGDTIIESGAEAQGIYYIDYGRVCTYTPEGKLLSTMTAGAVFGEMACFGNEKKKNTVIIACTETVIRRITPENLKKLPMIIKIFETIAENRKKDISNCQEQEFYSSRDKKFPRP
ncbi:cyclic nucleotide-binding domain-containing protein [Desulforhopalus vacuolatus]|nr:cyclic nucleotide-binding domain-containing protein [Desulforhopalus vacuolatus]